MFLQLGASPTVVVGPFVDKTDGFTAEPGLTIAQADRQIWKAGDTAFAATADTSAASHELDGWYSFDLDAGDTDTVGELIMQITTADALPVFWRWYVLSTVGYSALFGTTPTLVDANGRVDFSEALGTAISSHSTR